MIKTIVPRPNFAHRPSSDHVVLSLSTSRAPVPEVWLNLSRSSQLVIIMSRYLFCTLTATFLTRSASLQTGWQRLATPSPWALGSKFCFQGKSEKSGKSKGEFSFEVEWRRSSPMPKLLHYNSWSKFLDVQSTVHGGCSRRAGMSNGNLGLARTMQNSTRGDGWLHAYGKVNVDVGRVRQMRHSCLSLPT